MMHGQAAFPVILLSQYVCPCISWQTNSYQCFKRQIVTSMSAKMTVTEIVHYGQWRHVVNASKLIRLNFTSLYRSSKKRNETHEAKSRV